MMRQSRTFVGNWHNMEYKITVTIPARADIARTGRYIAVELHSPQSASALVEEIYATVRNLKNMPKRHALVADERLAFLGVRAYPINNYLVFYTVDDDTKSVVVQRILYCMRDWANLL